MADAGGADFVAKIVTDPKNPPNTIMLTGYLGASSEEGHQRLYFDASLSNYVEIPDDAILHSQPAADPGGLGASHVWIKRDAQLTFGPAGSQRPKGSFLEGPIMQGMGPGPGPGGGLQPTLLPPCPTPNQACASVHICPTPSAVGQCGPTPHLPCISRGVDCTVFPICRTPHVPCISLGIDCTVVVCRTPHVACISPGIDCTVLPVCHILTQQPQCHPTHQPPCPITLPLCPTETCVPSMQVICPTPSAVHQCGQSLPACIVSQVPQCPQPTGFACPSMVGCGPSVACGPSLACGPGQGGGVGQPAVAAAVAQPMTQVGCPTRAPELCPVTPACLPTPHAPCPPTHAPMMCPVTPLCPPTQFGHCPTHPPMFCPITPACPPTPHAPCQTHAPMFCPITPHCVSVFIPCLTQNIQCWPTINPAQCPMPTGLACPSLACPVQTIACGGGVPGGGANPAGG